MKKAKYEHFSLILAVLTMSFLVGYLVLAWTEPTTAPPLNNRPEPINTSTTVQTKLGALYVGTGVSGGALYAPRFYDSDNTTYWIDPAGSAGVSALLNGNVGIGTTPAEKLDVNGSLRVRGFDAVLHSFDTASNYQDLIGTYQGWSSSTVYIAGYNVVNFPAGRFTKSISMGGSGSERLWVNLSTGNVGIGTTGPNTTLDINGALSVRGMAVAPVVSPAGQGRIYFDSTANRFRASQSGGLYVDLIGTGGTLPSGTLGQTLRNDGAGSWVATSTLFVASSGNVGIGTTGPRTRLELGNDGAILAIGTYGSGWTEPNLGAGTRLLWYPKKAAIRAGGITGTQWNDANIGEYSTAFGYDNTASAGSAVGGGWNNTASGAMSVVGGGQNNITSGTISSVGGGAFNTASGYASTVGGGESNIAASAFFSTVGGGNSNTASGIFSTVGGGQANTASGYASTVGGGRSNIAAGDYSWAGGRYMQLTGDADNTFVWGYSGSAYSIPTANAFLIDPNNYGYNVGIGTAPSYKLDVNGALRLQPSAAPAPNNGVIYYDSGTNKFRGYQNGSWMDMIGGAGGAWVQNNVTASRSFGATYQNTSGGIMFVLIGFTAPGSRGFTVYTDSSSTPVTQVANYYSDITNMTIGFMVVPGNFYRTQASGIGFPSLATWTEWTGGGGVPSGAVMFFNLAACPAGWTELASAQGRYIVGLPSGGTLAGIPAGTTPLANLENRPAGAHTHSTNIKNFQVAATANSPAAFDTGGPGTVSTDSGAGLVAGTNAPYIQLLVCQKN